MEKRTIIRATTVPESLVFFDGTMVRLLSEYNVQLLSSPGEELNAMSLRYNVKTHSVEMYRRLSPLKDIIAIIKIIKVLCKERPLMIHSMTPKAGLLCMLAAWLTGVPVRVHTFTGLVWPTERGWKRRLLILTDKITCFCATHIIPEGEGVKNDLLNNGITKKPIKVLGFGNVKGVDLKKYDRTPEIMILSSFFKKNIFTFLFVGRIVSDKGINELCEAFNKLSKIVQARLVLIGPYESNLDPISKESKKIIESNPSIEYVGGKYGEELIAYYAASDCYVFPSYREGFPNSVLEAGAMGLPSIVTDINGSREIIVEGKNGVIIPSKDADALYKAMLEMIENKVMRDSMAEKAREMIASRFDQEYVRECLCKFYDEILTTKNLS